VTDLLSKVPGTGDFVQEARRLQTESDAAADTLYRSGALEEPGSGFNDNRASAQPFQGPPGSAGGPPAAGIPGMTMDPEMVLKKIYPILVFRYVPEALIFVACFLIKAGIMSFVTLPASSPWYQAWKNSSK
jgi:hypothetical protein